MPLAALANSMRICGVVWLRKRLTLYWLAACSPVRWRETTNWFSLLTLVLTFQSFGEIEWCSRIYRSWTYCDLVETDGDKPGILDSVCLSPVVDFEEWWMALKGQFAVEGLGNDAAGFCASLEPFLLCNCSMG